MHRQGHSRQSTAQRAAVSGLKESAQSVAGPLDAERSTVLDHHLAAELVVRVTKRHVEGLSDGMFASGDHAETRNADILRPKPRA